MNFLHTQVAPVIVQNIPAQSSTWLTQPVATLIAAMVALVVAGVTWLGIRRNHQQHKEKETSAAVERRREEAMAVLVEALDVGAASNDAVLAVSMAAGARGEPTDPIPTYNYVREYIDKCRPVEMKLRLLGLDSDLSMRKLIATHTAILEEVLAVGMNPLGLKFDHHRFQLRATDALTDLVRSCQRTLDRLRTKYDPPAIRLSLPPGDADVPPRGK
ncbi:hypothetical protein J6K27_003490 [Rhodococcus qingshengii]|uniref:hypothetical protein n=1 Tax=Rhodococcus qingshengii TaxID=334542 RepID=UPI001AEFC8EF|nr:hypothetical protein [Rhodococcus qingshengii]QTR98368.1 hypothetical protein J6K27_003490 [Rhodococcus qingshengii]